MQHIRDKVLMSDNTCCPAWLMSSGCKLWPVMFITWLLGTFCDVWHKALHYAVIVYKGIVLHFVGLSYAFGSHILKRLCGFAPCMPYVMHSRLYALCQTDCLFGHGPCNLVAEPVTSAMCIKQ